MSLFQFAACIDGVNRANSGEIEPPTIEELHAALAWVNEQEAASKEPDRS
jgi:hypothetical protein